MNQKQRAKWARTRTKGMWRFVLLYGILCWGGGMIIATSTLIYGWGKLSIIVPIYLVAGLVVGLACWFVGEYKYRKSANNDSLVDSNPSNADAA